MPDEFILSNSETGAVFYWRTDKGYYYREHKGKKTRISAEEYRTRYEESLEGPFC